jgi:hypothetical protein
MSRRLSALLAAATLAAAGAPAAHAMPVHRAPAPAVRTASAVHASVAPAAGSGRMPARLVGRLGRHLVRSGLPPAVVYALLAGGVLTVAGLAYRGTRRDGAQRARGAAARADAALRRKRAGQD